MLNLNCSHNFSEEEKDIEDYDTNFKKYNFGSYKIFSKY